MGRRRDGRDRLGFGLTDEARAPRPALAVASDWADRSVRDLRPIWPRLSVVVCAYNSADTIEECLDLLLACDWAVAR